MIEQHGGSKPQETGLQEEARRLLDSLQSVPGSLDDYFKAVDDYHDLDVAFEHTVQYAEYFDKELDGLDVSDVRNMLNQIRLTLLSMEQTSDLGRMAAERLRSEINVETGPETGAKMDPRLAAALGEETGADDDLVAVALLVDPVSFTEPQARYLPLLTRSMARTTFVDRAIIFDAPIWFVRWMTKMARVNGVDVLGVYRPVNSPTVAAVASALWQPVNEDSPYRDAKDAIRAAQQLA